MSDRCNVSILQNLESLNPRDDSYRFATATAAVTKNRENSENSVAKLLIADPMGVQFRVTCRSDRSKPLVWFPSSSRARDEGSFRFRAIDLTIGRQGDDASFAESWRWRTIRVGIGSTCPESSSNFKPLIFALLLARRPPRGPSFLRRRIDGRTGFNVRLTIREGAQRGKKERRKGIRNLSRASWPFYGRLADILRPATRSNRENRGG